VTDPRLHRRALLLSVVAVLASAVVVLVALAAASGVTERPGPETCCDTEFIDDAVLQLSWLVVPLLGVAAALSVRVALLGTAAVSVTQFLAMAETVHRYRESGWSDGLEVLGFLFPIALTVVALGAVLVGWLVGRRSPRGQDQ
jgi:hypothetical protein